MANTPHHKMTMEDRRFVMIFWFCVGITIVGILVLSAMIFLEVPKENQHTANFAMGFITGTMITQAILYLTGGSPPVKKPTEPTVAQTGDNPIMNVQQKHSEPPVNPTQP